MLLPKALRTLDMVLDYLTVELRTNFGAVQRLYDLESRALVTDSAAIVDGVRYVAAGRGKLKDAAYAAPAAGTASTGDAQQRRLSLPQLPVRRERET